MQPIFEFKKFGQIILINIDSNLPGAWIFRSVLGLNDNLSLIYLRATPVESSVGVYSVVLHSILVKHNTFSLICDSEIAIIPRLMFKSLIKLRKLSEKCYNEQILRYTLAKFPYKQVKEISQRFSEFL